MRLWGDFGISDVTGVFYKVFFPPQLIWFWPADVKTHIAFSHDTCNLFIMIADVILHPDHKLEGWAIFTLQGLGHWTHIPPLYSPGKPQCFPQWKPCLSHVMETFVYLKHKWGIKTNISNVKIQQKTWFHIGSSPVWMNSELHDQFIIQNKPHISH